MFLRITGASPAAFARPSEIFEVLPQFFLPSKFGNDTLMTLLRSVVAFLISFPLGLAIGAVAVKVPVVDAQFRSLVDFLRSIPGTSLVPVFFIIFGIGEVSKIAAAVYGGSLTTAIATIVGLQLLSTERKVAVASVYKPKYLNFWSFEFPEILPTLLVGLRTAISLCLVLVTVAEMFMGTDTGLGSVIMDSRNIYDRCARVSFKYFC